MVLLARVGEEAWLRAALDAVDGQAGPPREVVVVASPDSELAAVAEASPSDVRMLDGAPADSPGAMANRGVQACTGSWIALLQRGAVPEPGWLEATLASCAAYPGAGALAIPLSGGGLETSAISVARWGRVLPYRAATEPGQEVFGVSSRAGLFARSLLEDTGGFDPELTEELADADLALRGLLLGYRCYVGGGPGLVVDERVALLLEDRGEPARAQESRAWARSRVRVLLKALPREAWALGGAAIALELTADLYRSARDGRHPGAMLAGFSVGLREARSTLKERRALLLRRSIDRRGLLEAFAAAETELAHCKWQRLLRAVVT